MTIVYLFFCRAWRDFLAVSTVAIPFSLIEAWIIRPVMAHRWFLVLPCTGAAAFALLVFRLLSSTGEARQWKHTVATTAFILLASLAIVIPMIVSFYQPRTYDGLLLAWDQALGFQPSYSAGRLLTHYAWLRAACVYFYLAIGTAQLICLTVHMKAGTAWHVIGKFLVASAIAFMCFMIVPAVGPVFVFKNYPNEIPVAAAALLNVPPTFVRNCVPSLHFAMTILCFWNSRAWQRSCCAIFVGFTFLATLGLGQHYLFDLVLAVPLCALVELLLARRLKLAVLPCMLLIIPVLLAREMIAPSGAIVGWGWVALTVTLSLLSLRRTELLFVPVTRFRIDSELS